MSLLQVTAGYVPLTDAAPVIIAHELGFAEEEGLALTLRRSRSWSRLRDELAFGMVDAAHLLSPMPVAMTLGLGGISMAVDAVQVLSVNGDVIGVSRALAQRMRDAGHAFGFDDPQGAGEALLRASGGRLRIGVPFPFSMHAELVHHWLRGLGSDLPESLETITVPPPQMAEALASGQVDAFCVGEPWGSIAVETEVGELLLPGSAIWSFAPEKVLAMSHDRAEADPELTRRLMVTIWRACGWIGNPDNLLTLSEILARPQYLNLRAEVLEHGLSQRLIISPQGATRVVPQFQEFHAGLATFPWQSQGEWIAMQLARRHGLDVASARMTGRRIFRSDLYRRNLGPVGAELPGASLKLEGALSAPLHLATATTRQTLLVNRFFDGEIFDPDGN